MKTYLVEFEFRSGEYCQIFMRVFEAVNARQVESKIQHYLKTYYGDDEAESEHNTWLYFGGEVTVKWYGYEEIKNPIDVVERLKA